MVGEGCSGRRHFLLKAKELERSKDTEHTLMGLYCALAFITNSLPVAREDRDCGAFVGQVMDELEKKKQNLNEETKAQVRKRDWKKTKAVNKLKKHKASEQARGGESSVQDSHGNSENCCR